MADVTSPNDSASSVTLINVTQADSAYTLDRNDCPCVITNEGATGACVVNLPTDAQGGEHVKAAVIAAQDIAFNPGTGNRIIADDGSTYADLADGKQLIGDAAGERVELICRGPDGSGNLEWLATVQISAAGAGTFSEEES